MKPMPRAAIVAFSLLVFASHGRCDTSFSGQVVQFKTTTGVQNVVVTIKSGEESDGDHANEELGRDTTGSSGRYTIEFDEEPKSVEIWYDPEDADTWDRTARPHVVRVGPIIELDTIGLTNKQTGDTDEATQEQHARNTTNYAVAGGDVSVVTAEIRYAVARFGSGYLAVAARVGMVEVFEDVGIPFPPP